MIDKKPQEISKIIAVMLVSVMIFSSCASLSPTGVGRVKRYTLHSDRLPEAFDGLSIAYMSDIHYPSKFTRKRLGKVVACLNGLQPELLLLGGDYVTLTAHADELFDSLASVKTRYGIFAAWGNHENKRRDAVARAMEQHGVCLLADEEHFVVCEGDTLRLLGIADSFDADKVPQSSCATDLFTILLAHTPDYAQDTNVPADLVLSGHTHGGQVSLLGLYTPIKNTHYGTRFLRGLNHTDKGVPVITTNGVGTSRRKIRWCVPSEIVLVTLRATDEKTKND